MGQLLKPVVFVGCCFLSLTEGSRRPGELRAPSARTGSKSRASGGLRAVGGWPSWTKMNMYGKWNVSGKSTPQILFVSTNRAVGTPLKHTQTQWLGEHRTVPRCFKVLQACRPLAADFRRLSDAASVENRGLELTGLTW